MKVLTKISLTVAVVATGTIGAVAIAHPATTAEFSVVPAHQSAPAAVEQDVPAVPTADSAVQTTPEPVVVATSVSLEPVITQAAPGPQPPAAPRRMLSGHVTYSPSMTDPTQDEATCTYTFTDGSTEQAYAGSRIKGTSVELGCAKWIGQ